jgi:hypothetical protein
VSPDPLYELNRTLGEILADMKNLKADQEEDRRVASAYRREARQEFRELRDQVAELKDDVAPAIETIAAHAKTLKDHGEEIEASTIFRKRIGGIIAGGSVLMTTLAGGVWYLISAYWAVILDFIATLFRPKGG